MTGLITDPGFDINCTKEYKLSIQVSLDGFSFSIVHAQHKQLLALEVIPIELSSAKFLGRRFKEWVQKSKLLRENYHSTTLIYHSENLTFIPSEFYESNNLEVISKLVFGNQNDYQYIENYLTNAAGNLVFPVSKSLAEEMEQLFPEQKMLHPATVLNNQLDKQSVKKGNTTVLYFGKKSFTLFMYVNSQIKAINNYSYASAGDVVYYTIAAQKKLNIAPEKTALFLAGEIANKGEIHENLEKFFNRSIFFIPEVKYNSEIFKEPSHRFIVLF